MNTDLRMPMGEGGLSRRRFALALPLLGACALVAPGDVLASADPRVQRASRVLMGTRVDLVTAATDARDARALQVAMQAAFTEMARLEALMSRYRSDSEVSRIGAASGLRPVPVSPEVMAVLRQAQRLHRGSAGAFDPTIGTLRGWHFEPGQEAAQCCRLDIGLGHMAAQVDFDAVQVLLRTADLTGEGQQASVRVQQVGPVELVERRKQLAQCQVAQGAKQGKGARFDTDRSHDVGSFLKLV